uniref:Uncharacterized protein n=1 Tax=Sexangularia sp. CB-2014 TaxID=1486929 RepID=A0A7S1VGT9_9EUKA
MELNSPYPPTYDGGESGDLLGTSFVGGGGRCTVSDRFVDIIWSNCTCCSSSSERVLFPISEVSYVSTSSSYRWTRLFTLVVLCAVSALVGGLLAGQGPFAVSIACFALSGIFGLCFLVTLVRMCGRTVPVTFYLRHTQWYGSNVSHTFTLRHDDAAALVTLIAEKMQ